MRTINLNGFQACDIRGLYGPTVESEISPVHARLIGTALKELLPKDCSILIAGDARASTPLLVAALSTALDRSCSVLGFGVPTPVAYFAKNTFGFYGSAIVTASHNPPIFNGVKIQMGDRPASPEFLQRLRDRVAELHDDPIPPQVEKPALPASGVLEKTLNVYEHLLTNTFSPASGLSVVVDTMYGCYSGFARRVLEKNEYRVTALRNTASPDFHGITPNPADDNNLRELSEAVLKKRAAFGIALDGDGDRVRFVDEKARPVDNGTILVLLIRYLLDTGLIKGSEPVVYDQKMRLSVVHALRATGLTALREKSGHAFIRSRMLNENAVFGGECSGHFFWGCEDMYPVAAGDCGLFAALALGDMLRRTGRSLSALADEVPNSPYYSGDLRGLRFDGNRSDLLADIAREIDTDLYSVDTTDGVRIETGEAFAQLRPSVTESNMFTASFDAATRRDMESMAAMVVKLLAKRAPSVAETIQERVRHQLLARTAGSA